MQRTLLAALLLAVTLLAAAQPGDHTINLKDADIRVLIGTVSEITGKSFIVDPRVEGKVTVVSTKPMSADEVYTVFESVLRVHGYAAIPSGSMVKIVPEAIANQDGGVDGVAAGPDSLITKIVPLKHVSANELIPLLRPLVPQQGHLAAHQGSNALVISDRAANIARLESIIRRIDTASEAAVEVIPLQHADAVGLARTLTMLDDKTANPTGGGPKVFADARTNSILLSGDPAARLRLRALITHLDTPLESGESTQVIYLNYAKAEDLVPVLDATAATLTEQSTAEGAVKAANIQAHGETNALVITADPAVFRSLAAVVRQLDVRRAQVLIEAVIAEISDELASEIGVQWQSTNIDVDADGNIIDGYIGGTNFPGTVQPGIVGLQQNPGLVGGGLNIGYIGGTVTLPGSDDPILQIGALVTALKRDGGTNILSQPQIVTLDHQEAQIKVGQEVPFLTGQYTNTSTNGGTNQPTNPFQTIERKDVGLTLTVTPHINEGDSVRLDVVQEVSSLAPNVLGATDLITNKREVKTNVLISDGAMLVLGGLISDEIRESIQRVPALGDIPVVGNLFRYRREDRTRRNLMVFLKPTILRDSAIESAVSSNKYDYIRARQIDKQTRTGYARPDTTQPLLPEDWRAPLNLPEPAPPQ